MSVQRTYRLKTVLRALTLTLLVLLVLLQIVFRPVAPPVVRLKSEAERANLPLSADLYPCVLVTRAKPSETLGAAVEPCSLL